MIKSLLATLRPATSIANLLARADDHLLDDIGLTRADVDAILRDGAAPRRSGHLTTAQA